MFGLSCCAIIDLLNYPFGTGNRWRTSPSRIYGRYGNAYLVHQAPIHNLPSRSVYGLMKPKYLVSWREMHFTLMKLRSWASSVGQGCGCMPRTPWFKSSLRWIWVPIFFLTKCHLVLLGWSSCAFVFIILMKLVPFFFCWYSLSRGWGCTYACRKMQKKVEYVDGLLDLGLWWY